MMETTPAAILKYIKSQKEDMLRFLNHLVEAESPSVVPESQHQILAALAEELTGLDFHTELIAGQETGGHLLAMPGSGQNSRPIQLMIGHCDTVWPLGTLDSMPARIDGNRFAGPGVFDMKAGLVQMIFALKAIRALGLQPEIHPVVFINSDEEIGSQESTPHIIRLSKMAERAFILEPALGLSGKFKTARKGIGQFTLSIRGKSAHAGLEPEKGVSAIQELSYQIQRLYALADPARGITLNVGLIEGGVRPNVVAPESRAVVDVRILSQDDAKPLTASIHGLEPVLQGVKIEVTGGFGRPPLERTERNKALWEAARSTATLLDIDAEEGLAGGGSDGNTTSQYTATLDGLGPVGDGAHAEHEFILIDKLVERCALLALLILSPAREVPGSRL